MSDNSPETIDPRPDGGESLTGSGVPYEEDEADSQIRDLGLLHPIDSEADEETLDDGQPGMVTGVAAAGVEILSRLLELIGLDGDVICEQTGESIIFNIEGDDLGVLIGRRGLTLSALQYVVRLMIASRESEWPMLSVDVCGYKKRRHVALEELARKLAEQARYRHRPVTLEPMPPDERRVIHLALANHPEVYTESIGEEADRKVVIHPKRG